MHTGVAASLAVVVIAIAGCGPAVPSPVPASDRPAASATAGEPTPVATTPSPVASPSATLSLNDLDDGELELSATAATGICEPVQALVDPDAGESTIACGDALTWALAAVHAVTDDDVSRLFLDRPNCAASPCSEAERTEATIYVSLGDRSYRVLIDLRGQVATMDSMTTDPPRPTSSGSAVPQVKRASLRAAPSSLAKRDAMPFCGRTLGGDPQAVRACFLDAVIEGRPAEMIDVVYTAHGDRIVRLFRYTGSRPVEMFQRDGRTWRHSFGALSLGTTPSTWTFDPWGPGARMDLPG